MRPPATLFASAGLALALLPNGAAEAQNPVGFLKAGAGLARLAEDGGPAVYAGFAYGDWQIRGAYVEEFAPSGSTHSMWDVGLMRAAYGDGRAGYVAAGVGIGVAGGERFAYSEPGEDPRFVTVGIPGELSLVLSGGGFGLGLTAFGNLNPVQFYIGALVTLRIGWQPGAQGRGGR